MQCAIKAIALLLVLLLTSCSTHVQYVREFRACTLQCTKEMQQCAKSCRNNCHNCQDLAETEAAVRFNQYKHQQCVQGSIVALELQSFKDPLQCRKTTCACKADFSVCMQSCQGKIRKRMQIVQPC